MHCLKVLTKLIYTLDFYINSKPPQCKGIKNMQSICQQINHQIETFSNFQNKMLSRTNPDHKKPFRRDTGCLAKRNHPLKFLTKLKWEHYSSKNDAYPFL